MDYRQRPTYRLLGIIIRVVLIGVPTLILLATVNAWLSRGAPL